MGIQEEEMEERGKEAETYDIEDGTRCGDQTTELIMVEIERAKTGISQSSRRATVQWTHSHAQLVEHFQFPDLQN